MNEPDVARAVRAARAHISAEPGAQSVWRLVRRLDRDKPYVLVGFGTGAAGRVVAVDLDGVIESSGRDAAGIDAWWIHVADELVWAPGTSSRSPLYPLRRRLGTEGPEYLDISGNRVVLDGPPRA